MRIWYNISVVFILISACMHGQQRIIDSLKQKLVSADDTLRMAIYQRLSNEFNTVNMDTASSYAEKYIALSQKLQYRLNEAEGLIQKAFNAEQSSAAQMDLILKAKKILD